MKESMTKKQKFEEKAQKRLKDDNMNWKFNLDKKNEKYQMNITRRQAINKDVWYNQTIAE